MPKNKNTRVAIIHDVFIEQGGAERVLLAMLEIFPQADVYVPLLTKKGRRILKKAGAKQVFSSVFNNIPLVHSASILLKPILFWYWESLDLSGYDLVISSSHSFSSKAVITHSPTVHISYIHTSPRYLYDEFNETQIIKKPIFKTIFLPLLAWLRKKDQVAAKRPDILIANSLTVQDRIKKYYHRESVVIYPPIKIPKKLPKKLPATQQYYVCFSRLSKQKGIDLAIKACVKLGRPLKIIGEGGEKEYLQSLADKNVTFLGRVSDKKLAYVFAGAKAMIYPAIEEDFGMAPVEAMAYGVPVIAYKSGGVKESVQENKSGLFFSEWTVPSLVEAIHKFETLNFSPVKCRQRAQKFSEKEFASKFTKLVKRAL